MCKLLRQITLFVWGAGLLLSTAVFAESGSDVELIDPTRPLNYRANTAAVKETLVLNSILHSAGRKQAVINGQSVREKDTVNGAQVQRIEGDRVLVLVDGKSLTLRLQQQTIKTRTN